MPDEEKTFMVEDAEIIFRNFSGEETPFNRAGERNFCVVLDQETASDMAKDGWNIKTRKPGPDAEEEDDGIPYIQVKVKYKIKPPKVYLITSGARTLIDEGLIGTLDWADFKIVDLIARSYSWAVGDKSGIAAYLQTMFVTIDEDPLEQKYAILLGDGVSG